MPPLLWELTAAPSPAIVNELLQLKAAWFYLRGAPSPPIDEANLHIVLGISADALHPRRGGIVHDRLRAIGLSRCAAVMLQNVTPGGIKAGGPFHRLSQLRDDGTIDLFFAEADDFATAEWLLHHTPAHAIALPFSLSDLTARYRLLGDAAGFGTGIIACPGPMIWNGPGPIHLAAHVSFLAAEAAVTSILLPLPRDVEALRQIINAFDNPMPDAEREQWWQEFQQQVPEPPPPPRGVAPDFA